MNPISFLTASVWMLFFGSLQAAQHWKLESPKDPTFAIKGGVVQSAKGVEGGSLALDGVAVLEVKESAKLGHGGKGFTLVAWVNPYTLNAGQQMIVAKNVYSRNQREWGVMIDKDGRFRLYLRQGGWQTVTAETRPKPGHWHQVGVVVTPQRAELWINGKREGVGAMKHPLPQTAASLTFGGVNDGGQIWQNLFGALDEIRLWDSPLNETEMSARYRPVKATHRLPKHLPLGGEVFSLWNGPELPADPERIPFAAGIQHSTIHRPAEDGYKFLHGAAIVIHRGVLYANWANSPTNENGPHETLQGRRSRDGGKTWEPLEVVGPGFKGADRHSHGVLFRHRDELWTICSRFGTGEPNGRRFRGLRGEAFVLDEKANQWKSRGIVMRNCWPYDEPVRMGNGSYITGGQDKDGYPVVAMSRGDDFTKWDSVLIPFPPQLKPSFAETTVWADGAHVLAVIRGGAGVAWVSTSDDHGKTWAKARPSNLPMPRAKAYLGRLSTNQLYLVSNYRNRDTLCISVGKPGAKTLSHMWRLRHGKSGPPRFPGHAKGKQWSYPYAHEHEGKLYVAYSIGKEDCGLTVVPLASLAHP
ncbi:MAG: hypothetical protein CMO74_07780 [Verrucomicrobiales bacterium]|nr:hypothetical protein [Verrucomicrobiales bacterium]|tara:strand:+ start:1009 stop:2763 length:1755 start_codon:yes stop_codon:yes gene_type:complete